MSENAEAIFGSDNQVRLTIAAATNPVVALYTLYTLRHSELDASLMRRGTNQFRQRLPVPWMRSPSARADRDGIPDRNPEHRHDDRISDSGKERLNLAHVSVFGQPSGQAGWLPSPPREGVSPLRLRRRAVGPAACAVMRPDFANSTTRPRVAVISHAEQCFRPSETVCSWSAWEGTS